MITEEDREFIIKEKFLSDYDVCCGDYYYKKYPKGTLILQYNDIPEETLDYWRCWFECTDGTIIGNTQVMIDTSENAYKKFIKENKEVLQ
jgi:hypothetical protein